MALITNVDVGVISRVAVQLLSQLVVLPGSVLRVPGQEFAGPSGGSVTLRVPVPRASKVQTPGQPITVDELNEVPTSFTVVHHYDAANLTEDVRSLELENFSRQVLMPMVAAVAEGAEQELASEMNELPADLELPEDPSVFSGATFEAWARETEDKILQAGEILDDAKVPAGDRWCAVSPYVARRLLRIDKFSRVDASGERQALRQAILGSLYGFTFVKSTHLATGRAYAYHRSAFAFATLAPPPAPGVQAGTEEEGGITMRTTRQYETSTLTEQVVVDVFAGAATVDTERVFSFDTEGVS